MCRSPENVRFTPRRSARSPRGPFQLLSMEPSHFEQVPGAGAGRPSSDQKANNFMVRTTHSHPSQSLRLSHARRLRRGRSSRRAKALGAQVAGPIPLPTRGSKKFTVNRSPARRQKVDGPVRKFARTSGLLDIIGAEPARKTVGRAEKKLNLPRRGVDHHDQNLTFAKTT